MECAICKTLINKNGNTLSGKGADDINKVSALKQAEIYVYGGQQIHTKCRQGFTRDEYISKNEIPSKRKEKVQLSDCLAPK